MEQLINYIENYFQKYEETNETNELKNSLIADISDYYNELINQGMTEEEAITKAQESLGDMSQLTKDLPTNQVSITAINLKLTNADVDIEDSEVFDFEIKSTNPFTIQENTGSINIVQPPNSKSAKVKLYLTKDTASLNITNHHGNIEIDNVTAESLNLVISNGDVEIEDTNINSLNIINHDGDIELCDNTITSAIIENYNGDIEINQNNNFDSYTITNHNGDIEINCDLEHINLEYHNTNGDTDINITSEDIDYNKLSITNHNGDIEIN